MKIPPKLRCFRIQKNFCANDFQIGFFMRFRARLFEFFRNPRDALGLWHVAGLGFEARGDL